MNLHDWESAAFGASQNDYESILGAYALAVNESILADCSTFTRYMLSKCRGRIFNSGLRLAAAVLVPQKDGGYAHHAVAVLKTDVPTAILDPIKSRPFGQVHIESAADAYRDPALQWRTDKVLHYLGVVGYGLDGTRPVAALVFPDNYLRPHQPRNYPGYDRAWMASTSTRFD